MPTIQRFATCKIAVYADDHYPPHFHVEGRGFRVVVAIESLAIIRGDSRRARDALEWARDNRGVLRSAWERLNRRDPHA